MYGKPESIEPENFLYAFLPLMRAALYQLFYGLHINVINTGCYRCMVNKVLFAKGIHICIIW